MFKPIGEKNPHAVALAKLGAKKGGEARARKLSPRRRRAIARRAVQARWERYRALLAERATSA
ncbi:MAG: hypothetical protein QN174_13325 [Armatimonadota bacterium]|nr:hypothetical protein [Armatimonadota bacterium]